jgi:hypothetical protein
VIGATRCENFMNSEIGSKLELILERCIEFLDAEQALGKTRTPTLGKESASENKLTTVWRFSGD